MAETTHANPTLEFFFDCSSPWTYFAFTRLIPMAEELGVSITWRPILVGGVFNAVNQELYAQREAMFSGENKRRLDYFLKDLNDWARLCGLDIRMPAGHPISSVKAMRGAYYAIEQERLVPYAKAVFEMYWSSSTPDISHDNVLREVCAQAELNPDAFLQAIAQQPYKDKLREATDEVIARGAYGSPTLFINTDDMYFGNDRLPLVELKLRTLLDRH
ncbi:MAG: 2-hydroxychromene-2-carboxylate isomerase [Halioglobus sp.]